MEKEAPKRSFKVKYGDPYAKTQTKSSKSAARTTQNMRVTPGRTQSRAETFLKRMAMLRDNVNLVEASARKDMTGKVIIHRHHLQFDGVEILPAQLPYEDRKLLLKESKTGTAGLPVPWAWQMREKPSYKMSASADYVLDEEIRSFASWLQPTPAEHAARQAVVDEVNDFLNSAIGQRKTLAWSLFGSSTTGLVSPLSDVDVRVYDLLSERNTAAMTPHMTHLFEEIQGHRNFKNANLRTGTYSILTFTHEPTGIDVQIVAARDSKPQRDLTAKYLEEIPNLQDLFFVLRAALSMRYMTNVYDGGTGSYGLFVMIVAAMLRKTHDGRDFARERPSHQLFRFIDFYATLDYQKHGVAVFPRTRFMKHDLDTKKYAAYARAATKRGDPVRAGQWEIAQRKDLFPWFLTLQDPASPKNDLGKRTFAAKHIKMTMHHLRSRLVYQARHWEDDHKMRRQYPHESMLLTVVGRCHEMWYARRKRMEDYGQKVLDEAEERDRFKPLAAEEEAEAARELHEKLYDEDPEDVQAAQGQ